MKYKSLAISEAKNLLFGSAPHPLQTRMGMLIGGGLVYPELNFTLPTMEITTETMPEIRGHYAQIIDGALKRAVELEAPGVVIEFETLPPMTENPAWGIELTEILLQGMAKFNQKHGLKSVLRITPNDTRELVRPPIMREGILCEKMFETFEGCAKLGAELLSIESVGGKEINDDALLYGDIEGVLFALCVLGVRDMRFLWDRISQIAQRTQVHAAGDTACGFANTAMVLADRNMISKVFAAVVRAISAVRSLVAYECGAVGPGKDCGYENIFLKAITGYPMAMEGKTAACAHGSPVGNIAAAACDTWSNESVQNLKLLGGMAPTCYMEQLIYDCRLMNQARSEGDASAQMLQNWLVKSDAPLDPHAFILSPNSAIKIADAIVGAPNHYQAGIAAAKTSLHLLKKAAEGGMLRISKREITWIRTLERDLGNMPASENEFINKMMAKVDSSKFILAQYL